MPHTLLVSFSLLALVVTARPIAPVSDYSQPAEVQNAVKAIFVERTKQSNIDLIGITQGEVDIRLISDESQQAVLSQLDGSAVKALVPLEGTESNVTPEVQRLRDMLGGSKSLDDIEEPSGLTATTPSSPGESASVLTELSLTSLLAVYTLISLTAVLYTFYLIRGFLPLNQGEDEKRQLHPRDVELSCADERSTSMQEKVSDLVLAPGNEAPRTSHPPEGVLVNIDEDVIVADEKSRDAVGINFGPLVPFVAPPEPQTAIEKPWLVPLPPSPTSSPLRRTVQLREDVPENGNSQPVWAMVASEEQRREDARPGNATAAVDLALAMQLRTGFGVTADAAWLMRFVMALFGWIAILVGGGGERQATGRRLLEW
ncbi:hypothetical protein BJV77DRAFT_1029666 [Russula vinacea]|nr:hypothetical protein BJV77DRAFT_1029666 [Russula vinacea]